jgi:hypothetical protein
MMDIVQYFVLFSAYVIGWSMFHDLMPEVVFWGGVIIFTLFYDNFYNKIFPEEE